MHGINNVKDIQIDFTEVGTWRFSVYCSGSEYSKVMSSGEHEHEVCGSTNGTKLLSEVLQPLDSQWGLNYAEWRYIVI
jgi:hypothetical protein